jgi:hypothetical protein
MGGNLDRETLLLGLLAFLLDCPLLHCSTAILNPCSFAHAKTLVQAGSPNACSPANLLQRLQGFSGEKIRPKFTREGGSARARA